MFAVYNEQGRTFRSTLEDLYLVKGLKPAKRLKQVAHSIGDEKEPVSQSYYNKEAIRAYKQMIQAKHEETIYHAYQIMKRPASQSLTRLQSPTATCYSKKKASGNSPS